VATQAERDSYKFLQQQTAARVAQSCAGELEREVDEILGPIGVPSDLSRQVANTLQREETLALEVEGVSTDVDPQTTLENGRSSARLKFQSTVGLTPFLLQFGQGVEPVPRRRMYSSAATIGVGYLAGGAIPLVPYFFIRASTIFSWMTMLNHLFSDTVSHALFVSCILTLIVLLAFGVLKAHITGAATSKLLTM
jgi:VIT1/CCC1 family predicted Fe2+/Mn2+ transporter